MSKKNKKKNKGNPSCEQCLAIQLDTLGEAIEALTTVIEELVEPRVEASIKKMVLEEDD